MPVHRQADGQYSIAGAGGEDIDYDVGAPSEDEGEEPTKSSGSKRGPAGAAGARHTQRRRLSASIVDALLEPDSEVCTAHDLHRHLLLRWPRSFSMLSHSPLPFPTPHLEDPSFEIHLLIN